MLRSELQWCSVCVSYGKSIAESASLCAVMPLFGSLNSGGSEYSIRCAPHAKEISLLFTNFLWRHFALCPGSSAHNNFAPRGGDSFCSEADSFAGTSAVIRAFWRGDRATRTVVLDRPAAAAIMPEMETPASAAFEGGIQPWS